MADVHSSAISYYHHLIERNLSAAESQVGLLTHLQKENGILFGGRPLSSSLRPTFLTERKYTDVQDVVYLLRQAILRLAGAFFHSPQFLRDELGLEDWEIELAYLPTNVIRLSSLSRMDAFLTKDSFKFVEVNGESPAGIAYVHHLARVYEQLPVFQEFTKKFPVRFVSPLEHTITSLLQTYREQFDGREDKPSFAIVDFQNVPTTYEFELIREYLTRMGYPCEVVDPRALECRNGWIYANGRKIDILYRRLLMNEFWSIRDQCGPYLEGYKAQKTCFINSFRSKMVHKKALFAILTDERFNHVLSPAQHTIIDQHIPWTRMLRNQYTKYRGLTIDLLPFVRRNREYFVIKPNDEYGGAGVTLGFTVDDAAWGAALDQAIANNFVVQEVVNIHREPFLVQTSAGWQHVPTVIDLDPYLNGPLMGGCLTRTSASNLANVTAGGGTLPCFILRSTFNDA